MAIVSKHVVETAMNRYSCQEIIHPWNESCWKASCEMSWSVVKKSIPFFTVMYTAQILFKLRGRKKVHIGRELKGFLRTLLFVSMYGFSAVGMNCYFKKVLGKFTYNALGIWFPLLCGLGIFVENPGRKWIDATTILTGAFEGKYQSLLHHNSLKSSVLFETILFMTINGFLMHSLRIKQDIHTESPWFFIPQKMKEYEENVENRCFHGEVCSKSLQKEVIKFGSIAFLISSAKLILTNVKKPSKIIYDFFKWNNWRLTTFVALYIGIFKGVSCYLNKKRGDSLQNTFIAGLIAGISYTANPNRTFLFSLLTALLKVYGALLRKKLSLPKLPYPEILFILGNAYIVNQREFDRICSPKYVYNMFNFLSEQKAEIINDRFFRAIANPGRRIEF